MFLRRFLRASHTAVTAATFDQQVLGSDLAVLLVYHSESVACADYLALANKLVTVANTPAPPLWIKSCSIDADAQPALAAAFGVQRNRVPVTYFVVGGTIIDRLTGSVEEEKLTSCLTRFRAHYYSVKGITARDSKEEEMMVVTSAVARQDLTGEESFASLASAILSATTHDPITYLAAVAKGKEEVGVVRRALRMDARKMSQEELAERFYAPGASCVATLAMVQCAAVTQLCISGDLSQATSLLHAFKTDDLDVFGAISHSAEARERYARALMEVLICNDSPDVIETVRVQFLTRKQYHAASTALLATLKASPPRGPKRDMLKHILSGMVLYLGPGHPVGTDTRQKMNAVLY